MVSIDHGIAMQITHNCAGHLCEAVLMSYKALFISFSVRDNLELLNYQIDPFNKIHLNVVTAAR